MGIHDPAWGNNKRWYHCACGRVIHGRAYWWHAYHCPASPETLPSIEKTRPKIKKIRVLRFKEDLIKLILAGEKVTTWRKFPKRGEIEIACGGSWFAPNRTGIVITLEPIAEMSPEELATNHCITEGFKTPDALRKFLTETYKGRVPESGWLHIISFVKEPGKAPKFLQKRPQEKG